MPAESAPPKVAYTLNMFGNSTFQKAFIESFSGFEAEMEESGVLGLSGSEARDAFAGFAEYPGIWHISGYVASAFGPPTFLQLVSILQEPFSKELIAWSLGAFFKAAFDRLGRMFGTKQSAATEAKASRSVSFPIQFRPSMWFQAEQVLVTVICDLNEPSDFTLAETLIPLAFQRAGEWLERNGRTHPYVTYRITNGKLNNIPDLSADEPPKH